MSRGNNTNNNNITNVISRHHSDDVALGLYTDSTVLEDSLLNTTVNLLSQEYSICHPTEAHHSLPTTPRSGVSP